MNQSSLLNYNKTYSFIRFIFFLDHVCDVETVLRTPGMGKDFPLNGIQSITRHTHYTPSFTHISKFSNLHVFE